MDSFPVQCCCIDKEAGHGGKGGSPYQSCQRKKGISFLWNSYVIFFVGVTAVEIFKPFGKVIVRFSWGGARSILVLMLPQCKCDV